MENIEQLEFFTERLKLKVLTPDYAEVVLAFYIRNKAHLEPWEPERESDFYTLNYQKVLLEDQIESFKNGRGLSLWIFHHQDEEHEKVLGAVNFSNILLGPVQSCFLGYKMDESVVGKGFMTEAIAKGISIMFDGYKLHRIEASVIPRNTRSLRVLEKLGFEIEGYSPQYLKINGVWEDHKRFGIINHDL